MVSLLAAITLLSSLFLHCIRFYRQSIWSIYPKCAMSTQLVLLLLILVQYIQCIMLIILLNTSLTSHIDSLCIQFFGVFFAETLLHSWIHIFTPARCPVQIGEVGGKDTLPTGYKKTYYMTSSLPYLWPQDLNW